jgi:hypothetical protein
LIHDDSPLSKIEAGVAASAKSELDRRTRDVTETACTKSSSIWPAGMLDDHTFELGTRERWRDCIASQTPQFCSCLLVIDACRLPALGPQACPLFCRLSGAKLTSVSDC